jgi:hypothetical protein
MLVYAASGWWKDRRVCDLSTRYALLISIDVPDVEVDIYSAVQSLIKVPVEIATT